MKTTKDNKKHSCYCENYEHMMCDICFGTETIINIDDMDFVSHGLDGEPAECDC